MVRLEMGAAAIFGAAAGRLERLFGLLPAAVIAGLQFPAALVPAVQVPVEIPTTVIGLVAFVIASETAVIYYLLKQNFEMANQYAEIASKSAEGAAAVASGLREVATAVQQGRDVDALKRQIEELTFKTPAAVSRSRKSQA